VFHQLNFLVLVFLPFASYLEHKLIDHPTFVLSLRWIIFEKDFHKMSF
jgi:hypothetical protein